MMRQKRPDRGHERHHDRRMSRDLVTVHTFPDLPQAMLAKAMLESAGIDCILMDDNAARILGSDIAEIRVQVDRVDADEAIALLRSSE